MINQHDVTAFAYLLLRAGQPFGWDEVFVTYLHGWERAKYPGPAARIKVCWLALAVSG